MFHHVAAPRQPIRSLSLDLYRRKRRRPLLDPPHKPQRDGLNFLASRRRRIRDQLNLRLHILARAAASK
jgi:hypothetical protein